MARRRVTPVTPAHIDETLASIDSYEVSAPEAVEREFESMMRNIARQMGAEAFQEAMIPFLLPHEARWRKDVPNHPGLRAIDQWRESKAPGDK